MPSRKHAPHTNWSDLVSLLALPLLIGGLLWQTRAPAWSLQATTPAQREATQSRACHPQAFSFVELAPQAPSGSSEKSTANGNKREGDGFVFANNGAVRANLCQPAQLSLRATGSRAAGEGSHLVIWGSNAKKAQVYIDRYLDSTEEFKFPVNSGELWIEFRNDYYNPATHEDRNIILSRLNLISSAN